MKTLEFTDPHRKKHFEFFRNMNHPHFSVCANVDISGLPATLKERRLPFMASMVWLVSTVANEIPEFRQRIRNIVAVEHDAVHPSFSVPTATADVFSFCEVKWTPDYPTFIRQAMAKIELMKTNPSFEDEEGRDDYLFLSSFPWATFTSVQHAMSFHPHDSVPRIVWGKFFSDSGKIKIPLSISAHHALVDGRHAGQFYQRFESLASLFDTWLPSAIPG
jgi:chloramphenicol O-acetyltransferase type A